MKPWHYRLFICLLVLIFLSALNTLNNQRLSFHQKSVSIQQQLDTKIAEFDFYKNTDQVLLNQKLIAEIKSLKTAFAQVVADYELLIDLKGDKKTFSKVDATYALALTQLSAENYASASATLKDLEAEIKKESAAAAAFIPVSAKSPSGQTVHTQNGDFTVNLISADLKTTKVIVDTASDHDCTDNCPVMSLASFAQRSGAFAAINGPYFCPASYPACAAKKNSFDTLMMNKSKTYFNSDNNVYSTVPAAIFSTTSRFVAQSLSWGRDTSVDSVIAGQPLLVFNGTSQFNGDGDPKKSGKGSRAFIGATDSTVYIGIVYNATVADAAQAIAALGIKNAINLDSGGSTALWQNNHYLAGPGRDLPFGILLVKR